jgi:hypothetical protein
VVVVVSPITRQQSQRMIDRHSGGADLKETNIVPQQQFHRE